MYHSIDLSNRLSTERPEPKITKKIHCDFVSCSVLQFRNIRTLRIGIDYISVTHQLR